MAKLPKRPKHSSSLETWKRYEARLKAFHAKKHKKEADKKAKASLIAKLVRR